MQKDILIKSGEITKTFGMTKALTDVSLQIAYGGIQGADWRKWFLEIYAGIYDCRNRSSGFRRNVVQRAGEHAPKNMLEIKRKR